LSATDADTQSDVERTGARLAGAFDRVHRERMAGLPILHTGLAVAVVGGRDWQGHWLGVLITPWCMNLVVVPAPGSTYAAAGEGTTLRLAFPAGRFDFIVSSVEDLGPFAACSLFSPMHGFADQAGAEAVAAEVLAELFTPEPGAASQRAGAARAQPEGSGVSRRELLRGSFRSS
jgi:[NiFe] hydrogenase assembly HybE family chaperone